MTDRPPFVVRSADLPEHEAAYPPPFDAEKLSFGRDLGRAAGSRTLGAWRERLTPGRRTSFTHAHLQEEELVYVLAGCPTLRWIPPGEPAREYALAPGDFVAFPARTGIAHTIVNHTDEDADLLVVGERRPGERAAYPEDHAYRAWREANAPLRVWTEAVDPAGDARAPAVRIETERLVLRAWTPADAADLIALVTRNQEHLRRWVPNVATVHTLDEELAQIHAWTLRVLTDKDLLFGMFEPDGRLVGGVGLHNRAGKFAREVGYWVSADREGRGYVTEAVAALVRLGFDTLELDRLEIQCDPANTRSAGVPKRLGFVHEATLPRRSFAPDGTPSDSMIWSLYRSAYDKSFATGVRAFDALGRRLL